MPRRLPVGPADGGPPERRLGLGSRGIAGAGCLVAGVLWWLWAPAPIVVVVGVASARITLSVRRHRARRAMAAAEARQLPTSVVFAQLAVAAGWTPRTVPAVLGRLLDPPSAPRWHEVAESLRAGASFGRAIDVAFVDATDEALRLPLLLDQADRAGIELAPALARLADDHRRQRLAELDVRAQRLSVRLLFPLVFCLLPAFVLLSMVPLAAALLRDLPW